MEPYPVPANIELSTIVLLIQTLIDFVLMLKVKGVRKDKRTIDIGGLIGFLAFLLIVLWYVYFVDFGFRALRVLMMDGGFSFRWASTSVAVTFYAGYLFSRKYLKITNRKNPEKGEKFFADIFLHPSAGIVAAILINFAIMIIRRKFF